MTSRLANHVRLVVLMHRQRGRVIHTLLSAGFLDLCRNTISHQSVMRLELLQHLMRIIDEREPGALPTTVLCPEAEARDLVFIRFVKFCEFLAKFVLGYVGAVGV